MTSSETEAINEGEKNFLSQPAGYLLGKFGLLAILAGLLIAAWCGQVIIVILLGLVLSAAGLWQWLCPWSFQCHERWVVSQFGI